jgi:hypothetical protein
MKNFLPVYFVLLAFTVPALSERPVDPYPKPSIFYTVGNWKVIHHPETKTCNAEINMFSRPSGSQTNVIIETGFTHPKGQAEGVPKSWVIVLTNTQWTLKDGQEEELFLDTPSGKSWGVQFRARGTNAFVSEAVSDRLIASLTGSDPFRVRRDNGTILAVWENDASGGPTSAQLDEVIKKLKECRQDKLETSTQQLSPPVTDSQSLKPIPIHTGTIREKRRHQGIAPLRIEAPSGSDYIIKLVNVDTKSEELAIYVSRNATYETKVPYGAYRIRGASGQVWYGEKNLFGPNTSYFSLAKKNEKDDIFRFERVGNKAHGFVVHLEQVVNGNLETHSIKADEF